MGCIEVLKVLTPGTTSPAHSKALFVILMPLLKERQAEADASADNTSLIKTVLGKSTQYGRQ